MTVAHSRFHVSMFSFINVWTVSFLMSWSDFLLEAVIICRHIVSKFLIVSYRCEVQGPFNILREQFQNKHKYGDYPNCVICMLFKTWEVKYFLSNLLIHVVLSFVNFLFFLIEKEVYMWDYHAVCFHLSTFERVGRYLRNLIWVFCHVTPPQHHIF
jgi:hypothetical protein